MLSGQHKMVGDDVRFRLVTHGEQETRDDYTRHEKLHERVNQYEGSSAQYHLTCAAALKYLIPGIPNASFSIDEVKMTCSSHS